MTGAHTPAERRDPLTGEGDAARARPVATPPSRRARLWAALGVGIASGAATLWIARATVLVTADFGVSWNGARALLAGLDPYAAVGPGRRFPMPWPNLYPLTASIVELPLAPLPGDWARALFAGVTGALATLGLTRRHWHGLLALASSAALATLVLTQWSFGLVAAATVPGAAWLVVAKPNLGLACAAGWHTKRQWTWGVAGGALLAAAALVAWPAWPGEWIAVARQAPQVRMMVATPGGFLLLLALLRWRRPEARLLAALALVPHTPAYYDALLLFLVPDTIVETLALTLLTWATFLLDAVVVPRTTGADMSVALATAAPARQALMLALLHLPCLVMVLRRPNEGAVPAWADRASSRAWGALRSLGRRSAVAR